MCKKLIYLVSFILTLNLVGMVSAQEPDIQIQSPDEAMPIIDGIIDNVWSVSTEQEIIITIAGSEPSGAWDCSGTWRALWDWQYLYLLIEVRDERLIHDSAYNRSWEDDSVEVYVDCDNNKRISVDENDHQYCFRWYTQVETPRAIHHGEPSLEGVEYAVNTTSNGYLFEIRLPWLSMMGKQPTADQLIGIDVFINDDDDGGGRDTQISWHARDGIGWNTPSLWGTGLLLADIEEDDAQSPKNIYYVDADATGNNDGSSWANAYIYLQDALADANDAQKPVEIRVAQGTYTPDCGNGYTRGDKSYKFLLKSGVTIKGGFTGVGTDDPNAWNHQLYKTVLSGDLSGNDERLLENFVENSDHVIWCIDEDDSAVLDGFTITGGYATDRVGGGLLNYNANPTIRRCIFFDNYASQGGGMGNRYSSPTVSECTFSGNFAPYGGGGMYNDYSHPIVESCVFFDNIARYLGGGGMYCGGSDPSITNCLFIDNGAPFGGGMYNANANPTIINCTFSNNHGGAWGGGMQNDAGSNPRVTNCILWGDTPDEISFSGTATVTYSNIQGGRAGIGNINRDPKFADLEGRLSADSPCIDAGNNSALRSDITTTDLDGNPRIINGTVDMGAYEFGASPGPSTNLLAEAMDTLLRIDTGGNADWFSENVIYYHDGDAAQSGDILGEQHSWMKTAVSGAGTLNFFWKVSSEEYFDFLEFHVDGWLQDRISGSVDWHQITYEITDYDPHTLEWRFTKDVGTDVGNDCGWVDYVEWLPAP